MQAQWRHGTGSRRVAWTVLAAVVLAAPLAIVLAKPQRENVHRPDAECGGCHTVDRTVLEADPVAARTQLAPDIDDRCNACHGDEGPSHRTGIAPRKPVPDVLPLSSSGKIGCGTCHFVHGERDPFGDFVRIDNARGGLCLSCHTLEELQ